MKTVKILALTIALVAVQSCSKVNDTKTAIEEQYITETNQRTLLNNQPPPKIEWSLERDNLIKRFKMMNDKSISFYMYVFIEGASDPIGYYQVNKVSSVNSQLTNTEQLFYGGNYNYVAIPSPAEDGSYGSNGDGVFGFTPDDIYIEHNMKYLISSVPLTFNKPVNCLTVIDITTKKQLKSIMDKLTK